MMLCVDADRAELVEGAREVARPVVREGRRQRHGLVGAGGEAEHDVGVLEGGVDVLPGAVWRGSGGKWADCHGRGGRWSAGREMQANDGGGARPNVRLA